MSTTTTMTDAEIAKHMGWKGPGSYSAAAMRKVRALMAATASAEREACAQAAESIKEWQTDASSPPGKYLTVAYHAREAARAIRKRGES